MRHHMRRQQHAFGRGKLLMMVRRNPEPTI